jgi:UPF0716 protein FxsA
VFALLAIFIVVPIAELYVIFKVGDSIGWLPTLVLLAADSILGSLLMRSQGRAVWARFTEAMQAGRIPHREVLDGVLIIFGGAFLITPGFLTDLIGVTLLLPPTRSLWRQLVLRRGGRRVAMFVSGAGPGRAGSEPGQRTGWDVEGTAVEHDPPEDRDRRRLGQ